MEQSYPSAVVHLMACGDAEGRYWKRLMKKFDVFIGLLLASENWRKYNLTRMWANAQRDGRPAEHRWRPLSNAANFF